MRLPCFESPSLTPSGLSETAVPVRLGDRLIVTARADDEVIEAIEIVDATFAVAVQWHPEDRIFASAADHKLFEAFAARCVK